MNARVKPPTTDRVPMNVHPVARDALRWLLTHDLAGTGVGYSEFVHASVLAYERGEWRLPGVSRPTRKPDEWCPRCRVYHAHPIGEQTDAGKLIRECPRNPYPETT